jgi:hypothetical protein
MNLDKEDVEWLEKEYGEENFSIRNLALRLADIAALFNLQVNIFNSLDISLPVFSAKDTGGLEMAVKARLHYFHDKLGYRNSRSLFQKKIEQIQLAEMPSEKETISEAIFSVLQVKGGRVSDEKERKDFADRFEKLICETLGVSSYRMVEYDHSKFKPEEPNEASYDLWALFGIYGVFAGDISILMQIGSNE